MLKKHAKNVQIQKYKKTHKPTNQVTKPKMEVYS